MTAKADRQVERWIRVFVAAAACVCIVACGSSPSASATPNLANEYLTIVKAPNDANDALNAAVNAKPPDFTRIQAAIKGQVDADTKFNAGLLAMQNQASSSLKTDIQSARVEVSREIADLQNAQGCSDMTCINAALDRFYADYDASASVFVLLRSDLGLPPPPAASPTAT